MRFSKSRLFQLRLGQFKISGKIAKIVETIWDYEDLWRFIKICWSILTLHIYTFWLWTCQKSWRIKKSWPRNMLNSTDFSIRIKKNCREWPKFPDLDRFFILDWGFLVWMLASRQSWEISIEISQLSRQTF